MLAMHLNSKRRKHLKRGAALPLFGPVFGDVLNSDRVGSGGKVRSQANRPLAAPTSPVSTALHGESGPGLVRLLHRQMH